MHHPSMEAQFRGVIFKPLLFNRHISPTRFPVLSLTPKSYHHHLLGSHKSPKFNLFLSLSSTLLNPPSQSNPNSFKPHPDDRQLFNWHKPFASSTASAAAAFPVVGKGEVAAVVLGWLGAKQKHLRRYAELYTSRGINAITFVVPVRDVLRFDLGRKVEDRIREFAKEIVSWLCEKEGRERCLIFHTFSNAGWLVYGAILGHLQERPDLLERIRGCIIDSGPDPELNPKVWAAGFTAALLQKRNAAVYPLDDSVEPNRKRNGTKLEDENPFKIETTFHLVLEKIFSILFKLPDLNQRLSKIISLLSEIQPPCLQFYLYSTADKVIPFQVVESFMEYQKSKCRTVWSFNFESSPHVDHFRTYPDLYSSKVNAFLNEVLVLDKRR